jgi:DNA invertase Pin-like site-specific DNA recombinase
VMAGVRTARAKGKRIGRPRRVFRRDEALKMRAGGASWRKIADALQVPLATLVSACSEIPPTGATQNQRKQTHLA